MMSPSEIKPEAGVVAKKGKVDESKYLPELLAEKDSLDSSFTHAMKLISAGNVTTIRFNYFTSVRSQDSLIHM